MQKEEDFVKLFVANHLIFKGFRKVFDDENEAQYSFVELPNIRVHVHLKGFHLGSYYITGTYMNKKRNSNFAVHSCKYHITGEPELIQKISKRFISIIKVVKIFDNLNLLRLWT